MSDFKILAPKKLIRASAGTGKTYQLSSRYIALLHQEVPAEEILATTFTKKAAGEILGRILLRIAKATQNELDRTGLNQSIGLGEIGTARWLNILQLLVSNLHRVRVCTLDSYLSQLATTSGLELGLMPGWQIADEQTCRRLQDQAVQSLLANNPDSDVQRIMHLVGKGDSERSVDSLIREKVSDLFVKFSYSQKPAWEKVTSGKPLNEVELPSLLAQMEAVSLPKNKTYEDAHAKMIGQLCTEDWEGALDSGIAKKILNGESNFARKEIPLEIVEVYESAIKHIKATLNRQLANQNIGSFELLEKYAAEYTLVRSERQRLSFDDVTHTLVAGAREVDWEYRLDGQINHLLLDEFQDTSVQQWQLLAPLAQRISQKETGSFFCVGDTKQAIYGWRSGEVRLFSKLETEIDSLEIEPLQRSYRSAPAIIDVTNAVFNGLTRHDNLGKYEAVVRRWCAEYQQHETARLDFKGYATLETAPLAIEDEKQAEVTIRFAADRIAELERTIPVRSIGVLVRKNETVSRLIYELGQQKVLASEEGGRSLTDSAAVQLILSLVEGIDHPSNDVAWFHVAESPLGKQLEIESHSNKSYCKSLARYWRRKLVTEGYGPTVNTWAELLVAHCSRREASRLRQMVAQAYRYERLATLRPRDFAEFVRNEKVSTPEPVRVRVMTIHQAKGLEFDIVVLPELDVDFYDRRESIVAERDDVAGPITTVCVKRKESLRRLLSKKLQNMFDETGFRKVEEKLCGLYVSITRAAHALHMIVAPSGKQKSMPKTLSGLVRAALVGEVTADPETVLYSHGQADWCHHEPVAEKELQPATQFKPVKVTLAEPLSVQRQWRSPSQLGHSNSAAAVFRMDRSIATERGTLLHSWLEQVEWLEDGLPSDKELRKLAVAFGMTTEAIDHCLAGFRLLLGHEAVSSILQRSNYDSGCELEVRNEQRIAAQMQGHFSAGNIDRLVLQRRESRLFSADIIDFKTDRIDVRDSVAFQERIESYRAQLESYRKAVSQMFRIDEGQITARLLFTEVGEVVEI